MQKATRRTAKLHLLSAREVMNAGDGDHSDGGGLLLRIRGSDRSASWVFRFTSPAGRRREMGLGAAHRGNAQQAGATLTGARDQAHKARELLREGTDPIEARDKRRDDERQTEAASKAKRDRERWTLARCARDYHEREIEPNATRKHAAQWIGSLENHVSGALWHAPISAVTAPALLQALQDAEAHERARNHRNLGETLRRVRQRLDAVFEDAAFHGRCSANPAAAIGRKLAKARPIKAGKFAALDYRAAPELVARLRAMPGTAARCLEFLILSAGRTSEGLLAEWSEFDLVEGTHKLPAERMKMGEPHVVYLPARAVSIVQAQIGQDTRWVFPSPKPRREGQGKPLSNMALLAVLGRLGVRDRTTVHGLCRATFSTWANETGAARPDVIERCLAHKESNRVRAAYNRAEFVDERRALLAAWATYLSRPAMALVA
jgi:integrase